MFKYYFDLAPVSCSCAGAMMYEKYGECQEDVKWCFADFRITTENVAAKCPDSKDKFKETMVIKFVLLPLSVLFS